MLFAYGGRSAAGICRNERAIRIVYVDHGKLYVAPIDRSVRLRRHDQFARRPRIVGIGIAQHIRTENIRPQVSLPVLRLRKGGVEIVVGSNPQRYCPYFRRRFRDNGFRFGDDGFRHLTHGLSRRFRSTVRKHVCECTDHQSGKNYRNAGKKPASADIALDPLFIIVAVVIGIVYIIFGFRQFVDMPILNHVLLDDLLFDNLLLYDRMAHRLIFDRRFAVDFPAPLPLRFRIVNGRNGTVRHIRRLRIGVGCRVMRKLRRIAGAFRSGGMRYRGRSAPKRFLRYGCMRSVFSEFLLRRGRRRFG